jgi:membrane protein YqaA with SNARE-associated domain
MDASLWALFASAFISSTLLPGNSEIVLAAVIAGGGPAVAAVAVAYGLGRLLPSRLPEGKALARVRRIGPAALLLSWVPFVGDALCAAAGWLKLPVLGCTLAMAAGKLARYAALAHAMSYL